MGNTVYIDDIGTEVVLDTGVDITSATTHVIAVKKPGATSTLEWPAEIFETTKLKYIVQGGDIDVAGDYLLMAKVVLPGWSGHGSAVAMTVSELWE